MIYLQYGRIKQKKNRKILWKDLIQGLKKFISLSNYEWKSKKTTINNACSFIQ